MDAIGGFFSLELPKRKDFLHDDGVLLNSGRNALEYVLRAMGDVRRLWIPYYTCDVVLEPVKKLNIPYIFYHINERLEIEDVTALAEGECLLYTNYFGVKDVYVKQLAEQYGSRLIVDNAQAWFAEPLEGVSTIYSPRKYVGIPDGGIAYCPKGLDFDQFEQDYSYDRCSHLLKRIDLGASAGYADFKENSQNLCNQPIRRMSKLTRALLSSIDFEEVKGKRIANFRYLHEALKATNKFDVPQMTSFACPMVYPYLTDDRTLRQKLIENKVFVATYWPNVTEWPMGGMMERELMERLLPIPCDQRYGEKGMNHILAIVTNKILCR